MQRHRITPHGQQQEPQRRRSRSAGPTSAQQQPGGGRRKQRRHEGGRRVFVDDMAAGSGSSGGGGGGSSSSSGQEDGSSGSSGNSGDNGTRAGRGASSHDDGSGPGPGAGPVRHKRPQLPPEPGPGPGQPAGSLQQQPHPRGLQHRQPLVRRSMVGSPGGDGAHGHPGGAGTGVAPPGGPDAWPGQGQGQAHAGGPRAPHAAAELKSLQPWPTDKRRETHPYNEKHFSTTVAGKRKTGKAVDDFRPPQARRGWRGMGAGPHDQPPAHAPKAHAQIAGHMATGRPLSCMASPPSPAKAPPSSRASSLLPAQQAPTGAYAGVRARGEEGETDSGSGGDGPSAWAGSQGLHRASGSSSGQPGSSTSCGSGDDDDLVEGSGPGGEAAESPLGALPGPAAPLPQRKRLRQGAGPQAKLHVGPPLQQQAGLEQQEQQSDGVGSPHLQLQPDEQPDEAGLGNPGSKQRPHRRDPAGWASRRQQLARGPGTGHGGRRDQGGHAQEAPAPGPGSPAHAAVQMADAPAQVRPCCCAWFGTTP